MQKWSRILVINFDKNRIYGLDILRAMSIFLVLISHANVLLPTNNNPIIYLGFDGVEFFLSGFLIGRILIIILEHEKATVKTLFDFYIRRWFRTLPNYFLILITLLLLSYIFDHYFKITEVYKYFFFSQNLFESHPGFFPEAWSLPVEEWFYLLIPAILFSFVGIFHISSKRAVLITAISILLFTILFRYIRYSNSTMVESISEWDQMFRKQVVTRLDSLMFGLLGAYASYYYKQYWGKHKNILFFRYSHKFP